MACSTDGSTPTCSSSRRRSTPRRAAGAPVPKAIERGRLGDLSAAPELAALLNSAAPVAERREAAELLVGLPPRPETAAALARAAGDPDGALADWAAVGSVRLGDGTHRARVAALVGDARTTDELRVRAALALATAGDGSGIPVLAGALERHDDILLCRFIIVTLGKLGDRRAVPILLAHLPEVQNRREMVEALGALGNPAAVPALVESLRHDAYVPVRAAAATALAQIGQERRRRQCAIHHRDAGEARRPARRPVLLAHLPEVQNRREMVEALGALGDPAAVPALIECLRHDAYVPVRAAAATALAQIGQGPGAADMAGQLIAVLTDAARHDTEPMVVAAARAAAQSLKARP